MSRMATKLKCTNRPSTETHHTISNYISTSKPTKWQRSQHLRPRALPTYVTQERPVERLTIGIATWQHETFVTKLFYSGSTNSILIHQKVLICFNVCILFFGGCLCWRSWHRKKGGFWNALATLEVHIGHPRATMIYNDDNQNIA